MQSSPNLKIKNDQILLSDLQNLVKKEREVLTEILHHIREIEIRQLYLKRGYPSLFAFLTEEYGYSEAAAQRRIATMRLIKEIPEVEEKIGKGEISLSVASQVQSFFRKEDQKRTEEKKPKINHEEKLNLLERLSGTSARECEKKLIQLNPEIKLPKEKTKPITEDKTLVQFTANKILISKINRLKTLLSHQNSNQSLEIIFDKITEIALDKLDPQRRQARREKQRNLKESQGPAPRQKNSNSLPTSETIPPKPSRHIPKKLRDQIWLRDQGSCQYRDKRTGKTCNSTHFLELDHRFPFTLGGETKENNLELKCRGHNQYRSGLLFPQVNGA